MADLIGVVGYLLGAWGVGFAMGHVLKAYRDFMRQL